MAAPKIDSALGLRVPVSLDTAWAAADLPTQEVVLGLFDQCGPRLLRYVQAFGLQPDTAEDVVQEVFLALFRHLERGRSRENLRGWVFRVAHNLALKQRKRVRTRAEQSEAPLGAAESRIEPGAGPEDLYVEEQRRLRLKAAYHALPERDRRCLFLRAEGFRYRDIARILGVSLGTVAGTLTRAFSQLGIVDDE